MAEPRDDEEVVASEGEGQQGKDTPWYPYITKTQFEKFLSRLQGKIPEEIDRDYVRAIIRTPSMIYRFLRGVEAMGLIDDEQRPTDRLMSLVDKDNRRQAIDEVLNDLYPELLGQYRESGGEMSDRDMVAYFRHETGMGNDSANKMKMFFKYLLTEAEGGGPLPAVEETEETEETEVAGEAEVAEIDDGGSEAKESGETTGPASGNGRRGEGRSPQAADRRPQGRGGERDRGERGERDRGERGERDRGERGERDRGERGERDRGERGERDRGERDRERGASNRPLTEAQRAYLDTLKSVLRVNVDGDWDDDMIRLAFDRLERLFDRVRRN